MAIPILRRSDLLSEEELVEVAETRDLEHLLAISSRTHITEHLTTTLIMRGHTAVQKAIARNLNAQLSEGTFPVLLKIAERDEELAGLLGARSDIPAGLLRKFLAMVADKPKAAFLRNAPASIKAPVERGAPKAVIPIRDYSSAEKDIAELRRVGKLNDSTINRFAVMQQTEKLTVALALASDTSMKSIEQVLSDHRNVDQLVVACKASRVRWATTGSILNNREGCAPLEGNELEALSGLFEGLSLSEAQRAIRFGPTARQ